MIQVAELGTIVNVANDGNYGYHSFILGLKDIGKENKSKTLTDLRYKLYKYGAMSFEKSRHWVIYGAIPKKTKKEL